MGISGKFQRCSRKFQGCLKEVSMLLQRRLKWSFKWLPSFKYVLWKVSRDFQGTETFKGDSRQFQGNLKEVQRVFQGSFKWDKGSFKKLSSVFQENVKDFQGCFKNVSVMFCFESFLLLHDTNRSYFSFPNLYPHSYVNVISIVIHLWCHNKKHKEWRDGLFYPLKPL